MKTKTVSAGAIVPQTEKGQNQKWSGHFFFFFYNAPFFSRNENVFI